jgi:Holliday junction resolvase RusA-like endonuclease
MIDIVLTGQVPSNQTIYLQKWKMRFMKKSAKEIKEKRMQEVKSQYAWDPLDYSLFMRVKYYHWSHTKRDIDNYAKLVLDSMAGIVFVDDSQIKYLFLSKHYDKHNPRVEVSIKQDLSFGD